MNSDMIGGIIRAIAPPVIAYFIGVGILPAADYAPFVVALVATVTAAWSIKTNATGKVIK